MEAVALGRIEGNLDSSKHSESRERNAERAERGHNAQYAQPMISLVFDGT
jgi:hypothetical protein